MGEERGRKGDGEKGEMYVWGEGGVFVAFVTAGVAVAVGGDVDTGFATRGPEGRSHAHLFASMRFCSFFLDSRSRRRVANVRFGLVGGVLLPVV